MILHIETATSICSVALSSNETLLSLRESEIKNSHSEYTTVFISEILEETHTDITKIDAVAVSQGPGSYTGLRIGVSVAKGLCYALDKPLIGVSTLKAMAIGALQYIKPQSEDVLLCPMIDARRMEVYCAIYDSNANEIEPVKATILTEESFADFLKTKQMYFFGDGAKKFSDIMKNFPNAIYLDCFSPSAKYMIKESNRKFSEKQFENIVSFEPYYLKEFIAGKPNVKGLK